MGKLGHIPHKDSRDALFGMAADLRTVDVVPTNKVWLRGETLDQGEEGACVGFGWTGWYNCKPWGYQKQLINQDAFNWYYDAKRVDPWPGENYEGTTVRAGAKVAKSMGLLEQYVWAQSIAEMNAWLLSKGPIVVASDWYHSMDALRDSFVSVDPNSGVRGGHCYLLYGLENGIYHLQNSWGDSYADGGTFYMKPSDMQTLWNYGGFEAVTARQVKAVD